MQSQPVAAAIEDMMRSLIKTDFCGLKPNFNYSILAEFLTHVGRVFAPTSEPFPVDEEQVRYWD